MEVQLPKIKEHHFPEEIVLFDVVDDFQRFYEFLGFWMVKQIFSLLFMKGYPFTSEILDEMDRVGIFPVYHRHVAPWNAGLMQSTHAISDAGYLDLRIRRGHDRNLFLF